MSRQKLSLACGLYDRTDALRTGDVKVDGIDIDFIAIANPREIFDRMGGKQEFDVSEFSSSEFISRLGRGDNTFVALPVFPSRVFRHGYIYINRKAGIREPKDIAGKRVGVPVYTMTAAVWIRGHLMHQYGVDLSGCRWLEGAINHAGSHGDPSAPPLLKPIKIERDPQGRSLSELLAAGRDRRHHGHAASDPASRHRAAVPGCARGRARIRQDHAHLSDDASGGDPPRRARARSLDRAPGSTRASSTPRTSRCRGSSAAIR